MKKSKRSSRVRLTTMAALGGGAMLSACGGTGPVAPSANASAGGATPMAGKNDNEVQVYENVVACSQISENTREECEEMHKAASDLAAREAPRFATLHDCEAEYGPGKCVQAEEGEEGEVSSRRHFSPFVVAWFSSSKKSGAPLYNSKAGGYQTANGSRLGYAGAPGKYYATNRALERAKSVPKIKPASKMARSGGFGSRNGSWNLADRNSGKAGGGSKGG